VGRTSVLQEEPMKKRTAKRLGLSRETLYALQEIRLAQTVGVGLEDTTQPTNLPYDQPSDCDCPSVCAISCSCG
jgi:hypothetical protein